jgi:hypothetical protein
VPASPPVSSIATRGFNSSQLDVERLRERAAYYRCEAERAHYRARLYYRAMATHLEREIVELERVIKGDAFQVTETQSRRDFEKRP